jgi:uncharacterized protein (TIGR02246 family)
MMHDDEVAIRRLVDTWMSATMTGDLATVLGLMTDDVLFLVPGQPPFGKAEFATASTRMMDMQIEAASEIQEIQIAGDWAFLRSHIDMTVTPPSGAPVHRSGHALTILRKGVDGKWRLSRDANLLAVR